jgi:hypothetical protein
MQFLLLGNANIKLEVIVCEKNSFGVFACKCYGVKFGSVQQ